MSGIFGAERTYRSSRAITISPVKKVSVAPSVTGSFYELLIQSQGTDYRVPLTPSMILELTRSLSDSLSGKAPPIEQRASTTLPMNPDQLYVVRGNLDQPALFLSMIKAWRRGYYVPLSGGSVQQFIRKDVVENLPLVTGPLKLVASVALLDGNPTRVGDILVQRVSGTRENLGRPFYVESTEPLLIRGA